MSDPAAIVRCTASLTLDKVAQPSIFGAFNLPTLLKILKSAPKIVHIYCSNDGVLCKAGQLCHRSDPTLPFHLNLTKVDYLSRHIQVANSFFLASRLN